MWGLRWVKVALAPMVVYVAFRFTLVHFLKELAYMYSSSSMWIALLPRRVNTSPQRLELAAPPRVLRERIVHGPKTSKPTFVKGGAISVLSAGRSAIRCSITGPFNFLHVTHLFSSCATVLCPPTNQYLAWWMAPCLIWLWQWRVIRSTTWFFDGHQNGVIFSKL